jgi:glycosyltransferase involved in cell wall biosynthesis
MLLSEIYMTSICTVAKNEGPYLTEWIAYHLAIGVSQIVIYDNESTDGTAAILGPLAQFPWLRHVSWPTPSDRSPQLSAFNDYIHNNQDDPHFVALIDLDEFIALPEDCNSIREYLDTRGLNADGIGAVAVNQRVFGSAGELHYKPTNVIKRFQRAADDDYVENAWFKSFVRPSFVDHVPSPHCVKLKIGRYVNCQGKELDTTIIGPGRTPTICNGLRINHYIVKSLEEFRIKQRRGGGAGATPEARAQRYSDDFFFGRDAKINKVSWTFPSDLLSSVTAMEKTLLAVIEQSATTKNATVTIPPSL